MEQLSIEHAIAAGEAAMRASTDAAIRACPDFKERAERAILSHLAASPGHEASGEDLVDIAKAHGAVPDKDDRAFGGIFHSLQHRKLIRCIRSDLPRKRGHGTSGGKLWGLVQ